VLGDASPAFAQLVEKLTARLQPAAVAPPRAEPRPETVSKPAPPPPLPPAPEPVLKQFAIRIRQVGGSRTCRVIACGATQDDAVQAALAEVGDGWSLLDARPLG
jgi:hypothetical protein